MLLALGLGWLTAPACRSAPAPDRYPKDLAAQLLGEADVQEITACREDMGPSSEPPAQLLGPARVPLGDLPVAENPPGVLIRPPTQWTVPPFASLDPALPRELPASVQPLPSSNKPGLRAEVFGELPVAGAEEAPSAQLRPLPGRPQDLIRPRDVDLPRPFSLTRYRTESLGFFQMALYGGTTSYRAGEIYQSLKVAAGSREDVQGIGQEGFLTTVELPAPPPTQPDGAPSGDPGPPASDSAPPTVPAEARPFQEVDPVGKPMPELLDPGIVAASQAPAFQSIPTELGPTAPPTVVTPSSSAPAPAADPAPSAPRMLMLVAFIPDQAVVLEIAVDERIANTQQLLNLAMRGQRRLLDGWGPRDPE